MPKPQDKDTDIAGGTQQSQFSAETLNHVGKPAAERNATERKAAPQETPVSPDPDDNRQGIPKGRLAGTDNSLGDSEG